VRLWNKFLQPNMRRKAAYHPIARSNGCGSGCQVTAGMRAVESFQYGRVGGGVCHPLKSCELQVTSFNWSRSPDIGF
jgi:hypothetical protein